MPYIYDDVLDKHTVAAMDLAEEQIRKIIKEYRPMFKKFIAEQIDQIRFNAKQYIIPSRFPNIKNPNILRRLQPATEGVLTERTGKLNWMLTNRALPFGSGFTGSMKQTDGLDIRVRGKAVANTEDYKGTMKLDPSGSSTLFNTGVAKSKTEMPPENYASLLARFLWDSPGIRGEERKHLSISAENQPSLGIAILEERVNKINSMKGK